jgi:hypothetical protein
MGERHRGEERGPTHRLFGTCIGRYVVHLNDHFLAMIIDHGIYIIDGSRRTEVHDHTDLAGDIVSTLAFD